MSCRSGSGRRTAAVRMRPRSRASGAPWSGPPLAIAMVLLVSAGCGIPSLQLPPRNVMTLATADAFLSSVGVNLHLYYPDTPYGDPARVLQALQDLGVRHVRDGYEDGRPEVYAATNQLASAGVGVTVIAGRPGLDVRRRVAALDDSIPAAIEAVEGPNEFHLAGIGEWRGPLVDFQRSLYDEVRARPGLRRAVVVGPSSPDVELGASLDVGNIHPYPGGDRPQNRLAANITDGLSVSGGKPLWATETGYHDGRPSGEAQPAVTEAAAGAYVPRLYAEYFAAGIGRTFLYELFDQGDPALLADSEAHFGLLRFDGSPKPAYRNLRQLLSVLRAAGPGGNPGLLVNIATNDAHLRALGLAGGERDLVLLWRDVPVDGDGASDNRPVTVRLDGERSVRATALGARSFELGRTDAATVEVDGRLTVLEVTT